MPSDPTVVESTARPVWDHRHWRELAACRDTDPELFFPRGSTGVATERSEQAKAICASCPVRNECLTFAVVTNQDHGIWGGLDEEERRGVRRGWRTTVTNRSRDD